MQKRNAITRRRFVASTVSAAALSAIPIAAKAKTSVQKDGLQGLTLTPYLLFDGTCRDAMEFYQSCLGGDLELTKVKDSAARNQMPVFQQEKVLNARLRNGTLDIEASDWLRQAETPMRGNTMCMYLSGGNWHIVTEMFDRLAEGADITDPLKKEFFGYYGALNDRYGVRWMFLSQN